MFQQLRVWGLETLTGHKGFSIRLRLLIVYCSAQFTAELFKEECTKHRKTQSSLSASKFTPL